MNRLLLLCMELGLSDPRIAELYERPWNLALYFTPKPKSPTIWEFQGVPLTCSEPLQASEGKLSITHHALSPHHHVIMTAQWVFSAWTIVSLAISGAVTFYDIQMVQVHEVLVPSYVVLAWIHAGLHRFPNPIVVLIPGHSLYSPSLYLMVHSLVDCAIWLSLQWVGNVQEEYRLAGARSYFFAKPGSTPKSSPEPCVEP